MSRRSYGLSVAVALAFLLGTGTPVARASFGFLPGAEGFEALAGKGEGVPEAQAGSHPAALSVALDFKLAGEIPGRPGVAATDGDLRDLHLQWPGGLIENPLALRRCSKAQFNAPRTSPFEASRSGESCPAESQVGVVAVRSSVDGGGQRSFGLFNLTPRQGQPSQLGFAPYGVPITLSPHVRQAGGEYGITLDARNLPQSLDLYGLTVTIWGTPWAPSHNGQRANCLNEAEPAFPWAKCPPGAEEPTEAYLTLPTSCDGPLTFSAVADSWQDPGAYGPDGEPNLSDPAWQIASSSQQSLDNCAALPYSPLAKTVTTTDRTSTATGLDFNLEPGVRGLLEPGELATSPVRKTVVSLPEGLTINPSVGAGLGVCSEAGYGAETVSSPPGAGCPNASKIGDFTVKTPLLEKTVEGALFLATPFHNPFGSLLALYLVAKSPERGILVKVAGQVSLDHKSGQLIATFDRLPQLPYSLLQVHFREGQRAPLLTPDTCGSYGSQIELSPWLDPNTKLGEASNFKLTKGIGGAPCPAGIPPFNPGAQSGTLNSNAGSYTPFFLDLTRTDAEQEITAYSAQLPPGLLGKIAGVPFCSEAAIQAAKQKSGIDELEHPSCPAASAIGHTVSGYGAGVALTYAPGGLYLAGPYHGAPLSVVAVDSALVGPFDLGVIIVRSAIVIDPRSAQVSIDSAGSDPIPHIIDGIPIHLRDVRIYISRPSFTLNPTSCDPFAISSSLSGSAPPFLDPKSAQGGASVPFQVSNCSALKFKPRFSLRLKGGTRRGQFPSLRATYLPRPGNANTASAQVTLPSYEFLEQGHIGTVCTKGQLEAEACPAKSLYGHATAVTPLLEEPLRGSVYLRSSDHPLPDLVSVLHGRGVRILLEGRIDSVGGGLRATFTGLPDAPVTKFTMVLFGGKRGLLVNEQNVCTATETARARFASQSNLGVVQRPALLNSKCKQQQKKSKKKKKGRKR